MSDFEDFYEILGVDPKATPDEITKAWKDKFWILAPDRMNGAPETAKKRAEEELKKVNNAYDTLKEPQKRRDYDKQWHQIKDKPKPVVDPQIIRFNNVNPKEIKTGSFTIRNLGGPYNRINVSNPNTWVKVARWHSLTSADELPLQVEIEAVGEDFGKSYTEQIKVTLDDEETFVRIELETRPQLTKATGTGAQNQTFGSGSGTPAGRNKKGWHVFVGISAIIIIILGIVLWNHFRSPSSTPIIAQATFTSSTASISSSPFTTPNSVTLKPTKTTIVTKAQTPTATKLTKTSTTYAVGLSPSGICFDGTNIWVTNSGSSSVTKVRASDGSILGTYPVGSQPEGLRFDGKNIWLPNSGSHNIIKLASNGSLLANYAVGTLTLGLGPNDICFDANNNIWLTTYKGNSVIKLRASDGSILGTYAVASNTVQDSSSSLCFDGTNIWVTNASSSTITKLKASDGSVLKTYTMPNNPYSICFDGTNIWVTNSGSSSVTKVRASDGSILGTYPVGAVPMAICFDGTNIWVANVNSSNITELRASDGSFLGTYTVGSSPFDICFDGTSIWVANGGSNNITKLMVVPVQ